MIKHAKIGKAALDSNFESMVVAGWTYNVERFPLTIAKLVHITWWIIGFMVGINTVHEFKDQLISMGAHIVGLDMSPLYLEDIPFWLHLLPI